MRRLPIGRYIQSRSPCELYPGPAGTQQVLKEAGVTSPFRGTWILGVLLITLAAPVSENEGGVTALA